ncbi:MAG: FtsX-like permease family protein [Candidatus Moranbacteria bacterium]|nr:FtsX-like permease family protein [Candidatus Moranbacteria bacterium]
MNQLVTAFNLAVKSFKNNVSRTVFSLLGIVIGVASVILIMALGNGIKAYVIDQVEVFGTDLIEIEVSIPKTKHSSGENIQGLAGATKVTSFKLEEAEKLAELDNVAAWYGGMINQGVISNRNENKTSLIFGVSEGIKNVDGRFELERGRMFSKNEARSLNKVVVLGSKLKEDLFSSQPAVGQDVKIEGKTFEVIGVLKERGSGGFFDFDSLIYMPVQTLQKKFLGIDYIQFAFFKVKDTSRMDQTVVQMNLLMRDFHDIEDPQDDDFVIASITEAVEIVEDVFDIINIMLLVLTSISLIVGGVGITNVMYVAVAERTFEIGLRKALGARNKDILNQFLIEAVLLTLIGGIIGIVLGFVFSQIFERLVAFYGYNLNFSITIPVILVGFGFSSAVGLIFGFKPAQKAARLSPMEALRR